MKNYKQGSCGIHSTIFLRKEGDHEIIKQNTHYCIVNILFFD